MQPPAKEAGRRGPGERAGEGRAKGPPAAAAAAAAAPLKPGWVLTLEGLAALSPAQRHSHLLFGDLLEDVGAAASVFPRESAEPGYRMPDPRAWTQPLEPPGQRQDRLLGILKAAEARGRVRALRLRYARMRVRRGAREERGGGRGWGTTQLGALRARRGPRPQRLRSNPAPRPPGTRRRRRSRSSSCGRSPRAPPSGWRRSCRRS